MAERNDRRGGLDVGPDNPYAEFFQANLVAIRAAEFLRAMPRHKRWWRKVKGWLV